MRAAIFTVISLIMVFVCGLVCGVVQGRREASEEEHVSYREIYSQAKQHGYNLGMKEGLDWYHDEIWKKGGIWDTAWQLGAEGKQHPARPQPFKVQE